MGTGRMTCQAKFSRGSHWLSPKDEQVLGTSQVQLRLVLAGTREQQLQVSLWLEASCQRSGDPSSQALPVPFSQAKYILKCILKCILKYSLLETRLLVMESESILKAGIKKSDKRVHPRRHGRALVASATEGVAIYI